VGKVIDIASKRKKKQIHILLCLWEDELAKILTKWIEDRNGFQVTSLNSSYEEDLLKAAEAGSFDMFVLLLNNIIYHSDKPRAEALNDKPFELVSYLKITYEKPVIALYGYPDDPNYANKVRMAGADFVFRLPFQLKAFQEAIEDSFNLV
jgi:hypothetical protein